MIADNTGSRDMVFYFQLVIAAALNFPDYQLYEFNKSLTLISLANFCNAV